MGEKPWFTPLVWMDYRVAVLFAVIAPLILLVWSFVQKSEAVQRLFIIYWRVASLLAIALYLMINAIPIGFVASWMARLLIPISLWFWTDINEEINELPQRKLKLAVTSWRWAITVYTLLGALLQIPFLSCAFSSKEAVVGNSFCRVWLDAPWGFKQIFHANTSEGFLGFLGVVGLIIYVVYSIYFVFFRLSKQGRSAIEH